MNWHVVHTKVHREQIAVSSLERLGIEVFCPEVRERKLVRRCLQLSSGPLFPGYIFARFDLVRQYRAVIYARGVRNLVSFGSIPATIHEELIDGIKTRLHERSQMPSGNEFKNGQVVQLCKGPLGGFEAIFEKKMSGNQRAVLLLRALSYQARVMVDLDSIVNY